MFYQNTCSPARRSEKLDRRYQSGVASATAGGQVGDVGGSPRGRQKQPWGQGKGPSMTRLLSVWRLRRTVLLCVVAAGAVPVTTGTATATPWSVGGQNIQNTRSTNSTITSGSVDRLKVKWTFTTHGDVSANPAVVGNAVYFPDWGEFVGGVTTGGYLYKLNAKTG